MQDLMLFTDGSVHAQSKLGYGAYLVVSDPDLELKLLQQRGCVKRFVETSSSKLELQTLLWALSEVQSFGSKVVIYTDSQNIIGLPGRREQLEHKEYRSSRGTLLNNHELYQEFYRLTDLLDYELVKVCGHLASKEKGAIDRLFALVDKASRKALREALPFPGSLS